MKSGEEEQDVNYGGKNLPGDVTHVTFLPGLALPFTPSR